jgi:hypothetical protein
MLELNAKGEEKGEDELDKRLAVVKELKVGRFIVEINGDGAVGWTVVSHDHGEVGINPTGRGMPADIFATFACGWKVSASAYSTPRAGPGGCRPWPYPSRPPPSRR